MRLRAALGLTTLSGVAYGLAFPPVGWWPLAWVALAPFLVAVAASGARRAAGLGLWLGVVASYSVGTWMPDAVVNYYQQSIAVGALIFLACAFWQAAWQYAGFALCARRFGAGGGTVTPLLVGAAWISAETARVAIPFGNPWALLGYSQAGMPLLVQTADLAGVAGVGFVVAAANAALAGWWCARSGPATERRAALAGAGVVALLVALLVGYGAVRLRGDAGDAAVALPVAAAQANLDLGTLWKSEFYGANLEAYAGLTTTTTASHAARLVVWPESALTFFLESEPAYRYYLAQLVARAGTTLLTGGPRVLTGGDGREEFRNAAFLVSPTGATALVYEKGQLVPFAEYFPLAGFTLLRRQFGKVREFTPGALQTPFATPLGVAGMMICNEAMLGAEAIARVRQGAEWLVTLTNDSWVGRRQYAEIALAMVRLRAVEVRRWLVRASTSGPSAMIDPAGRIVDVLPFDARGVVRAELVPRRGLTVYARIGDAFAWGCVLVTVLASAVGARRRPRAAGPEDRRACVPAPDAATTVAMHPRSLRRFVRVLVLVGGLASAPVARAATVPAVGQYDLGLQAGYMFGVTNNAQAVTFLPRAGRIMWVGTSEHPGVVSFGVEGLFTHYYETNSAMDLGGGPYLRYRMVRDWVQPYAEVGVGMLYNDLKHFSLSSRVLFSVNGAVGVEVPLGERWGATVGYRFRHISNAGQDAINPGLNANIFAVGVGFTY